MSKIESAKLRISELNPQVEVKATKARITPSTAMELLSGHDIIVDSTDNYQSRYILSDACILLRIPLMSGSAIGFEGQLTMLCHPQGPWYGACAYS